MGEYKVGASLRSSTPQTPHTRSTHNYKMGSPLPGASNLTTLLRGAPTAGNATLLRCPSQTLTRLRQLNEAEFVALFTPVVPHPPGSDLASNMDPFEPLGRSFPRKVRHVPYRLDNGMTSHADYLPSIGAIVVVICSTANVIQHNANAFQQQLTFARDIAVKVIGNKDLTDVPLVLLLITNGAARQTHLNGVQDFPALVTLDDYTTAALSNAVGTIFGW